MAQPNLESIQVQLDLIMSNLSFIEYALFGSRLFGIDRSTIEDIIRTTAISKEVDPNLAVKVAKAESNLDPFALRVNKSGSVDRGLFQWNSYYHPEVKNEEAFNPWKATELFCDAVKAGHLSWWNSSKAKWNS